MKFPIIMAMILFLAGMVPLFAYIDPGSGSALLSVIIGAFVALAILVKTFWYKILGFLGLSKAKKKNDSLENEDKQ